MQLYCFVCKNILPQLFCLKSLFEWKYVVPLQPFNENSSASDPYKKFRDITHNYNIKRLTICIDMFTNQSNNNAINSVKMTEIFGHFNNCVITYLLTYLRCL